MNTINPLNTPLNDFEKVQLPLLIQRHSQEILQVAFKALKDIGVTGLTPEQVALVGDGRFVVNMQLNFARQLPERALYNALMSKVGDPMITKVSFTAIEDEVKDMVRRMPATMRAAADAYEEAIKKADKDNESHLYDV